MGLFDDLVGTMLSGEGGEGQLAGIMEVLSGLDAGGVNGLVQLFQQNGLGEIISSWIGSGENLPITAEQVAQGLGSDLMASLSAKSGISGEELCRQIAEYLPDFIDKITPGGTIPEGGLMELGMQYVMGAFA